MGGHHHNTFYAVAALDIAGVPELAEEMQGLRLGRHDALYDWESEVDVDALVRLREVASALLDSGSGWLSERRPDVRLAT